MASVSMHCRTRVLIARLHNRAFDAAVQVECELCTEDGKLAKTDGKTKSYCRFSARSRWEVGGQSQDRCQIGDEEGEAESGDRGKIERKVQKV
mmetsp:Transcript_87209/g.182506  ORF Transcript_87209/g.182506 Transcript_87209/m.182506 type:complete len:93 (-) Transcript_87209:499-777(-)